MTIAIILFIFQPREEKTELRGSLRSQKENGTETESGTENGSGKGTERGIEREMRGGTETEESRGEKTLHHTRAKEVIFTSVSC